MPLIEDHHYLKICAQLASSLSISIAAARRKVDLAAAKEGVKDRSAKKEIAQRLLDQARLECDSGEAISSKELDKLLTVLAHEENFMVED